MKKNKKAIIVIFVVVLIMFCIGGFMLLYNPTKESSKQDLSGLELMVLDCNNNEESTNVSIGLTNTSSEKMQLNGLELVLRNRSGEAVTTMTISGMGDLEANTFTQIDSTFPGNLGKITEVIVKK